MDLNKGNAVLDLVKMVGSEVPMENFFFNFFYKFLITQLIFIYFDMILITLI
jgi:hypothetical protein